MSAAQRRFNKVTARIEKFEKKIKTESARLERLLGLYLQEVQPSVREKARLIKIIAGHLAGFARRADIKKSQADFVLAMMHGLYTPRSPLQDPAAAEHSADDTVRSKKRRSAQHIATVAEISENEEAKNYSIRSVYIALAKVSHPDTETDPDRKAAKEEIMKQVASAYQAHDLMTLLRLELEWVHKEHTHLGSLADHTLDHYISALEDQMAELKKEKTSLAWQARFAPVAHLSFLPEPVAVNALHRTAEAMIHDNVALVTFKNTLESMLPAKDILQHIKEFGLSGTTPNSI